MKVKFIGKAKLTKQGQLTLPLEARQDLNIELDNDVYWYEVDDYLILVKELFNEQQLIEKVNKKKR